MRPARELLQVLTGVAVALVILFLFQLSVKTGPGDGIVQYEEVIQPFRAKHTRAELAGLLAGIFVGSFLANFLFRPPAIARGLWISLFVTGVVVISPWQFVLPKEIIIFALPVWMIVGLAGYYASRLLRHKKQQYE
jgi:hypothetical protein